MLLSEERGSRVVAGSQQTRIKHNLSSARFDSWMKYIEAKIMKYMIMYMRGLKQKSRSVRKDWAGDQRSILRASPWLAHG